MAERLLRWLTAGAGLAVVGWIALASGRANPLAWVVTALIAAVYAVGVLELHRFQQATGALALLVDDGVPDFEADSPAASRPHLDRWLARVPPALQPAVRRRIEGEPAGLPGPALAPALAGLLVLLGMLGTFLGMVATLRGTGAALAGAPDLAAVRDSLVAPVRGLGLAFGTSVAGIAASAALGLSTALCRRRRVIAGQRLDAWIATHCRVFSAAHQRAETLALLRRQAESAPALLDGVRALTETLERQSQASAAALLAGQARFHARAGDACAALAASVDRTLRASVADSARLAGETVQAAASGALERVVRDTTALQAALATSLQAQLDGFAARVEAGSASVAETWQIALEHQARSGQRLIDDLRASHDRVVTTSAQRCADLLGAIDTRLAGAVGQVTAEAGAALAQQASTGQALADTALRSLDAATLGLAQHADSLQATLRHAHAELATASADREAQRAAALVAGFEAMATSLQRDWQTAASQARTQQIELCETVTETARGVTTQAAAQAHRTGEELTRLLQSADAAPRAAAELMAQWRQQTADAMARDHALLQERARLVDSIAAVLAGVGAAATGQRAAVDALVASAADALAAVAGRVEHAVQAQVARLAEAAVQVGGGAVEVASLGEAFGVAVQRFGEASDRMGAHLQRLDTALAASMTRSDEQLAYHVAQAREVIDLSMLSQRQIIEELQRLAASAALSGAHAT